MIDKISPGEIEKLKTIFNIKLPIRETPNKNETPEPVELKPIGISITTDDLQFSLHITCYNTDKFSDIEAKFYKEYPDLKDETNFFIANGIKIESCKTLIENGIKDHDTIKILKK